MIPVTVVDKDGNIVKGLTAKNFRGKILGKRVEVLSVKDDTQPRHIAIAVDLSMSQKEKGLDSVFLSIAERLIVNFTPRNNVSLYSFAGSVFVEASFTRNRKKLQEVVLKLVDDQTDLGSRTTSLWDAIYLISRTFPEDDFAGVLYLISDAGETSSTVNMRNAEDALLRSGARVFVLCFPPPQRLVYISVCSHFPKLSGGLVIPMSTRRIKRIKTVDGLLAYAAMYHRSIDQVYRLEVELPGEIR